MPNLPPGERLLLTVDRDVERDCKRCGGRGRLGHGIVAKLIDCPTCHGTGRVTRRLRGVVIAQAWCEDDDHIGYEVVWSGTGRGCEDTPSAIGKWDVPGLDEGAKGLIDEVVRRYRAKTLPPEIAANLTEVDCE